MRQKVVSSQWACWIYCPLRCSALPSICLHGPGSSDVSVMFHRKGASVMAPVTDKGIKGLKPLFPFLHRQLGQGNNSIWYFVLEKSLFPPLASPQPPERLYMTLTRFRAHYGLKSDLSRQRRGLFVVKASFPACSFCRTLSLHLYPFTSHRCSPSPPAWLLRGPLRSAPWQVRGFQSVYLENGPCETWLMKAISLCHVFGALLLKWLRPLFTDAESKLHHPDPLSLSGSLWAPHVSMKRGMEKAGGKKWSPADTHVCSVFHDSGVYPVKIHSSLRTIIKRVILIFFSVPLHRSLYFW